jgi:hypothetical protein
MGNDISSVKMRGGSLVNWELYLGPGWCRLARVCLRKSAECPRGTLMIVNMTKIDIDISGLMKTIESLVSPCIASPKASSKAVSLHNVPSSKE